MLGAQGAAQDSANPLSIMSLLLLALPLSRLVLPARPRFPALSPLGLQLLAVLTSLWPPSGWVTWTQCHTGEGTPEPHCLKPACKAAPLSIAFKVSSGRIIMKIPIKAFINKRNHCSPCSSLFHQDSVSWYLGNSTHNMGHKNNNITYLKFKSLSSNFFKSLPA